MLSSRTALLQALRQGPGYGQQLMRRVAVATRGRARLVPGSVYPALQALEKAGRVRSWTVIPGRARGGRARTYYELTVDGVREAELEAQALGEIARVRRPRPPISVAERAAMRVRVERVAELFDFASQLRDAHAGRGQ